MNQRPSLFKRKLWVDRSIQLPLLAYSITMAAVGTAAAAMFSVFYVLFLPQVTNGTMLYILWGVGALFCLSIMVGIGLFVTNRVAGPLLRMKEHMEALSRGESPEPLTPRKDDYVNKDLIDAYNRLVEKKLS